MEKADRFGSTEVKKTNRSSDENEQTHVSYSRRTRTEDPTSGTKATLASNPLPERFGDSDLADCATRSLQVRQAAEERLRCENEQIKKFFSILTSVTRKAKLIATQPMVNSIAIESH